MAKKENAALSALIQKAPLYSIDKPEEVIKFVDDEKTVKHFAERARLASIVGIDTKLVFLYLGKRLTKTQQMSNWNRRPLTSSQLHYAACDALVLIHLYDVLLERLLKSTKPEFSIDSISNVLDVHVEIPPKCTFCFEYFDNKKRLKAHRQECSKGSGVTPEDLVDAVESVGFGAMLKAPPGSSSSADPLVIELLVEGMMCQKNCGTTVQNALKSVDGVASAEVSFEKRKATVTLTHEGSTTLEELVDMVDIVGFVAYPYDPEKAMKIIMEDKKAKQLAQEMGESAANDLTSADNPRAFFKVEAKAIVLAATEQEKLHLNEPSQVHVLPGRGIEGDVALRKSSSNLERAHVLVGNTEFLEEKNIEVTSKIRTHMHDLEMEGKTYLKSMGLDVWLITGDNIRTASAIARAMGIDHVKAIALPELLNLLLKLFHVVCQLGFFCVKGS
ncbi:hypothetical protein ATCC90586_002554 [Pythium insidiosum]|nr:hypothetical protein ATCC90586_002554 [Pythium insidiosum]